MSGQSVTPLFLGTSFLVIALPGPDFALLTSIVLRTRSRPAGFAAAAGMVTAGAGHTLLALSGTALVLSAHPALFTALRLGGAGLMLVWGTRMLRDAVRARRGAAGRSAAEDPMPDRPAADTAGPGPARAYLRGVACTAGNPKVALFLLAYLPQFVAPGARPAPALAELGGVYLAIVTGWLSLVVLTLAAAHDRARRRRPPAPPRGTLDALLGTVFVAFAVHLAW